MPSGAKKRKAAKRRKEQEQQQQQQLGSAHSPGSPTSTTTESSSPPQGNGLKEEDDLTSHDGKGSESGSDIASPTAQGNHHQHHLGIGEEEQSDARVEDKTEDYRKEKDPPGSVDIELIDGTVNGGDKDTNGPLAPQKFEETAKETGKKIAISVADVEKDEIAPLLLSNPVLHISVEIPISESEAVSVEHVRSEKDKDVSVSGEVPSPVEFKQSEALDTGDLVEQPVHIPISEEVVQATNVPDESLGVVDNMAVDPSDSNEEKLVPLTDVTNKGVDPTVESHQGRGSYKTTQSSEVVRSTHLEQRASWLSCCGIFDVIASASN